MFLLTSNAYALTDCPSDQSLRFHNCFGAYTFTDGEKYVGEWQDDKRHGQGTYTFASGDKYVGKWKDDKKHGQGTFTFANGDKYVGEFKDDMRHGQGTATFANGEQWEGYYLNDKYIPSTCENMGLVKGSSEFGQCVITLINKL